MDRGVWQATVHGVTKNRTRLSTHAMQCSAMQVYEAYIYNILSRKLHELSFYCHVNEKLYSFLKK